MGDEMSEVVTIGDATLYHGDCLEILPTLDKVDAVVTDPPYGIGFEYYGYDDTRDNLRNLISGLWKHKPESERVVILPGITQISEYPHPDWIGCITWNTTGSFGKYGYTQWMPVLLYGKDLKGFGNVNGVTKSDTLRISGGAGVGFQRTKEEKEHTCPKPENLMRLCVNRFTDGEVLDPFMGSGTTGVACMNLGRKFIGIEIEERYFDIACKRIEAAYAQPDMFIEPPAKAEQTSFEGVK